MEFGVDTIPTALPPILLPFVTFAVQPPPCTSIVQFYENQIICNIQHIDYMRILRKITLLVGYNSIPTASQSTSVQLRELLTKPNIIC